MMDSYSILARDLVRVAFVAMSDRLKQGIEYNLDDGVYIAGKINSHDWRGKSIFDAADVIEWAIEDVERAARARS
jgi:hypothetical protein